jgi:hypothetical protein
MSTIIACLLLIVGLTFVNAAKELTIHIIAHTHDDVGWRKFIFLLQLLLHKTEK